MSTPTVEQWSVQEPLMTRAACPTCGHLHRLASARLCDCCRADVRAANNHEPAPRAPSRTSTLCRTCGRPLRKRGEQFVHIESTRPSEVEEEEE